MDDKTKEISIKGVGRVGTRSRTRSRAHRYWVVTQFNPAPVPDDKWGKITGHEAVPDLPQFKTGTLAAKAARDLAKEIGGELTDYAKGFLRGETNETTGKS